MQPYVNTISELLEKLKKKELSARELVTSCLERIEETDKDLHAFITVDGEGALRRAEEEDRKRDTGRHKMLSGIPVSVKDLLCTSSMTTTCGSQMLKNFVPPYNATVVEKLEEQGAVIVGKATMDEFAMGSTSETCAFGAPQNP
ncbi:MAG: amidase, partial [bacterium]